MQKTILITGSTDGIGFETAQSLLQQNHHVIIHGRSSFKLEKALETLKNIKTQGHVDAFLADLSDFNDVIHLSKSIIEKYSKINVLINNAGILKTPNTTTKEGYDSRFMVNTISPFLLTKKLLPLFNTTGRIINLSSAAQSPINIDALLGNVELADMDAYAQSKLAITMWSQYMADEIKENGPAFIAINPGSFLATKMVKEGFNMEGNNINIGSDILVRAALSDEFSNASGKYLDNDIQQFNEPHIDALNPKKVDNVVNTIKTIIEAQNISF